MKFKNSIGMVALVLATLGLAPQAATAGDIWSIVQTSGFSAETPAHSGQDVTFRMTLLNGDVNRDSWDLNSVNKSYILCSNPGYWNTSEDFSALYTYLHEGVELGIMTEAELAVMLAARSSSVDGPKIGVWVSGSLRFADLTLAKNEKDPNHLTDVNFTYKVQPGDLAVPFCLADGAGNDPTLDTSVSGYYFVNLAQDASDTTNPWTIRTLDNGDYADFTIYEGSLPSGIDPTEVPKVADTRLFDANICIRTFGFSESDTGIEGIWRTVPQGRTKLIDGAIEIPGGASEDMTLYVWVDPEDTGAVTLDPTQAGIETGGDGSVFLSLSILAGEKSASFRLAGVAEGGTARIYVSSNKGFLYTSLGDEVLNYLTATVKCTEPLLPDVTAKVTSSASESTNQCDIYAKYDYMEKAANLRITLSDAFTSQTTVRVTPATGAGAEPAKHYIGLSANEGGNAYLDWDKQADAFVDVVFAAGELYKDLNVYTLYADDSTAADGITFNLEVVEQDAAAFFSGGTHSDTMFVRAIPPVIVKPEEGESVFGSATIEANVNQMIDVTISDMYRSLVNGEYTVSFWDGGTLAGTDLTARNGVVTLEAAYSDQGTNTSTFRLTNNASGRQTEGFRSFIVNVKPGKKVWLVSADGATTNRIMCTESDSVEHGFNVVLSDAYVRDLYAFLKPVSDGSEDAVRTTAFTAGVLIPGGDTVSPSQITLTFPDGTAATKAGLVYQVQLRTSDDTTTDDNIVATYTADKFYAYVSNEVPEIQGVIIGGIEHTVNGGTFEYPLAKTIEKELSLMVGDVEADLGDDFECEWVFSIGGTAVTKTTNPATFNFPQDGTYKVKVHAKDKDMAQNVWSSWFEFNVIVSKQPTVKIVKFPATSNFKETETYDANACGVSVVFDPAPPVDVKVNLTVQNDGGTGALEFEETELLFSAGETEKFVYPVKMDGTAATGRTGFTVRAELDAESIAALEAVDYIYNMSGASARVKIDNIAPVVSNFDPMPGVTNTVSIGESVTVTVDVSDILADAQGGFTFTWTSTGNSKKVETVMPATENDDFVAAVFTTQFSNYGDKEIRLTVKDKDGGTSSQYIFNYVVEPAKPLKLYPLGPSVGSGTELSATYRNAPGLGSGVVSVDPRDATFAYASSWVRTFNSPKEQGYAGLWAHGYAYGEEDSVIGPTGSTAADGGDVYKYEPEDGCDSFFYCWLQFDTGEGASTISGKPNPQTVKGRNTDTSITLADAEENATSFKLSSYEAVFSREWIPSDNLGDINSDGIPDYYAISWGVTSNYGDYGEGGDLYDYGASNADEDMLPAAATPATSLIPDVSSGWATDGGEFTAKMELRGYGDGLNFSTVNANHMRGTDLYAITDLDLTDDEAAALNAASGQEFDLATEEGREAAKAWMLANSWSPENPTDPRKADTDGDGFTDGWEYYFWYNSKIMGNKGRKLNATDPTGDYIEIAPADIAAHFDPNTYLKDAKEADFDADGLSDYEEFLIGTNPVDCDSDGDGLPDGWEIMRGLNPLDWNRQGSQEDPNANPDGDYMAKAYGIMSYTIYDVDGVYYAVRAGDEGGTMNEPAETQVFKYGSDWCPASKTASGINSGIDWTEYDPVASFVTLVYIHNQVYSRKGFDPRTGWYDGSGYNGYLGARWMEISAGQATDTVPFTTKDEWLLSGYMTKALGKGLDLNSCTTMPLPPFERTYGDSDQVHEQTAHGADSNGDGIPDGWTLYVGGDPNATGANLAAQTSDKNEPITDGDGLDLLGEFAGIDSVAAYSGVESIADGLNADWRNKFFPTDPNKADTDGDGISDGSEGEYVYIKGETEDDGSLCFAGGGMNPCTVDTDFDCIPDGWEATFAGAAYTIEEGTAVSSLEDVTVADVRAKGLTVDSEGNIQASGTYVLRGMDATVQDANYDLDGDGLMNWQEYCTQSLRQFRFDDGSTPLLNACLRNMEQIIWTGTEEEWEALGEEGQREIVAPYEGQRVEQRESTTTPGLWEIYCKIYMRGPEVPFVEFNAFNEAKYKSALEEAMEGSYEEDEIASLLNQINFKSLGYFTTPPNAWDYAYTEFVGANGQGRRFMFAPTSAGSYITTSPVLWDSDSDGMDDFWEIFHGMDPLLATITTLDNSTRRDYIAYLTRDPLSGASRFSIYKNPWVDVDGILDALSYNAVKYPWVTGCAEFDADGDGVRNEEEAIKPNLSDPRPMHSDPTPLWYTDTSKPNSFTTMYYQFDPMFGSSDLGKSALKYPWTIGGTTLAYDGSSSMYRFSFEQNEGYDSDGDWTSDKLENVSSLKGTSDPLVANSPDRRQAIYFPGGDSAAVSYQTFNRSSYVGNYDALNQFTVECWVRPDEDKLGDEEQVVLERVFMYPASTLANSESVMRANFRVAIADDGCPFGLYDSSDAVDTATGDSSVIVKATKPLAAEKWAHLALSFDGSRLRLYVDGVEAAVSPATQLRPANGVTRIVQDVDETGFGVDTYSMHTGGLVVGAQVRDMNMLWGGDATWMAEPMKNFFQGYVDEVRIWDGARTGTEILADYTSRARYTDEQILANKQKVFAAWTNGATRATGGVSTTVLPPELLALYTFQTLPGAIEDTMVETVPTGFKRSVVDNAVDAFGNQYDVAVGWWRDFALKSIVYYDDNLVPWIGNAVAHMPYLDGSAADSLYWTDKFAGWATASETDSNAFAFPNSGIPYGDYNYLSDRQLKVDRNNTVSGTNTLAALQWRFELRTRFIGNTDLIPVGGAYAKRCADYWDGEGAMDAWQITGDGSGEDPDADEDGLPDWWEAYAESEYGLEGTDGNNWNTMVDYFGDGFMIPAWEAYMRDIVAGIVSSTDYLDGTGDAPDMTVKADVNADGLPDWWQQLYGINASGALEDPDNDGLSNRAEYLISEIFRFAHLNPTLARTGIAVDGTVVNSDVLDYFQKEGQLYYGSMFADHDKIDDFWEDFYDIDVASRYVWDARSDEDGDGWSNWSEACAGTSPNAANSLGIDGDSVSECPTPIVRLKVTDPTSSVSNSTLVVQAWGDLLLLDSPDAEWTIGSSASDDSSSSSSDSTTATANRSKYLGWNTGRKVTFNLGPGQVAHGSVVVKFKDTQYWMIYTSSSSIYSSGLYFVVGSAQNAQWVNHVKDRPRIGSDGKESSVGDLVIESGETSEDFSATVVGEVNYETGEAMLDLGLVQDDFYVSGSVSTQESSEDDNLVASLIHPSTSYVKVEWYTQIVDQGENGRYYLSQPDKGRMKEGKNTFIVFRDDDGDGAFTPGEPYGFAPAVDVGWDGVDVNVELTTTSAVAFRADLTDASRIDRLVVRGSVGDVVDFTADPYSEYEQNLDGTGKSVSYSSGDSDSGSSSSSSDSGTDLTWVRVRVMLWLGNGVAAGNNTVKVLDKIINIKNRPVLTEADFLNPETGDYDVQWNVGNSFAANMTNATYRVFFGNTAVPNSTGAKVASYKCGFCRKFDVSRITPTPLSPANDRDAIVYASHPTFTWKVGAMNEYNTYSAFSILVDDAKGNNVWSSGIQLAPPCRRDVDGVYSYRYEAPLFAGSIVENSSGKAALFHNYSNYTWRVTMYNKKYMTPAYSASKSFLMSANSNNENGYGGLAVKVKYRGPDAAVSDSADMTKLEGKIRVQAFKTGDFTGMPAGEVVVSDIDSVTNGSITVNAVIPGLSAGPYYVRSFIDTNGNGERDVWESWGYACGIGKSGATTTFVPMAITVGSTITASLPECEVWIEDVDTDGDWLPDVWEIINGTLATRGAATLDGDPELDDFVRVNPELSAKVQNRVRGSSASLTGMSLGAMSNPTLAALMMGVDPSGYESPALAVQAAVSPDLAEDGVTVESLAFDGEGNIVLEVSAETKAGTSQAASVVYGAQPTALATVRYEVLWRENLTDGWTSVASGVVEVGGEAQTITVPREEILVDGATPANGFFKVSLSK